MKIIVEWKWLYKWIVIGSVAAVLEPRDVSGPYGAPSPPGIAKYNVINH